MSFVSPIRASMITSAKPTKPARSMTAKGIARPRTFSATAQKMWPPSSGRNGNRLTTASESEMSARTSTARCVSNATDCARGRGGREEREDLERALRVEGEGLARRLVRADDARDLLVCLRVVEDPHD